MKVEYLGVCWVGAPDPPEHSGLIRPDFMASVHTLPGRVHASVCFLWGSAEPDDGLVDVEEDLHHLMSFQFQVWRL